MGVKIGNTPCFVLYRLQPDGKHCIIHAQASIQSSAKTFLLACGKAAEPSLCSSPTCNRGCGQRHARDSAFHSSQMVTHKQVLSLLHFVLESHVNEGRNPPNVSFLNFLEWLRQLPVGFDSGNQEEWFSLGGKSVSLTCLLLPRSRREYLGVCRWVELSELSCGRCRSQ